MTNVEQLKELIVRADEIEEEIEGEGSKAATKRKVERLISAACEEGTPIRNVLDDGLIAGMDVVGARFKKSEIYISEVLIAARAMKMGMDFLEAEIIKAGIEPAGKCLIGTVQGDLHDIGKNLVAMMLKGAGFKVIDLGADVTPDEFAEQAETEGVQVVGMSALLTTTMPGMEKTIKAMKDRGVSARTMIGGAPVTQDYADRIGADGYAADAASAVDLAKSLIS
ncbi:MAG: cobalamin-dependent protein [Planctomycetota bacterium]|jgi:5-methyltetrahydrofolate--homocysteine methyltransferase